MAKQDKETVFSSICPLKQVDNDILISYKGDLSVLYKMELPDVMSLTEDDYLAVQNSFASSVNSLPVGYLIQRIDFVYHLPSELEQQNESSYLEYKNLELLNARYATRTLTYFIITLSAGPTKATYKSSWFEIFGRSSNKENIIDRTKVSELLQKSETIIRQIIDPLRHKKIDFKRLTNQEINHFVIQKYFGLSFYKSPEPSNSFVDYADLKDAATVGGSVIKVFSLLKDGFPTSISNIKAEGNYYKKGISELPVSYLHDLSFNLNFPHVITQVIYAIDNT